MAHTNCSRRQRQKSFISSFSSGFPLCSVFFIAIWVIEPISCGQSLVVRGATWYKNSIIASTLTFELKPSRFLTLFKGPYQCFRHVYLLLVCLLWLTIFYNVSPLVSFHFDIELQEERQTYWQTVIWGIQKHPLISLIFITVPVLVMTSGRRFSCLRHLCPSLEQVDGETSCGLYELVTDVIL